MHEILEFGCSLLIQKIKLSPARAEEGLSPNDTHEGGEWHEGEILQILK